MKNYLILFIFVCLGEISNAQSTIKIHSIANNRMNIGDTGYTLDGTRMYFSRAKLLKPQNFGTSGVYPKSISIVDAYEQTSSLENIADSTNIDIFFFGMFDTFNTSLIPFTSNELDALKDWSVKGGKLIVCGASPIDIDPAFNPNTLNSRWGFELALEEPTQILPTPIGLLSTIFSGPFGIVNSANQGGSSQGYFTTTPNDKVVLAKNDSGATTLYLDCATLDLVIADGDAFTDLGGISNSTLISNQNDRFWANTIAYMDQLQGPPELFQNGTSLSTGEYSSYQWYYNGDIIENANSNTIEMDRLGQYFVKVNLDCGCNNVSSGMFNYVGINEIIVKSPITIIPNPVENGEIKFSNVSKQISVKLYDSLGKLLDSIIINPSNDNYSTEMLTKGIYFLVFTNMDGSYFGYQKLIKL